MTPHAKSSSAIETLRKPASRAIAVLFVLTVSFTKPHLLGTGLGEILQLVGYSLLIAAALGRIWCAVYISGRKDRILCQDGPYSLCRNPLYFFSMLGVVGFFAAVQSPALFAAAGAVYLVYYRYVIRSEETRLAELFGADFQAYVASTPRFFPAWHRPRGIDSCTVRPRIIERALGEVVWFLLAIVLAEALSWLHQNGHLILFQMPF